MTPAKAAHSGSRRICSRNALAGTRSMTKRQGSNRRTEVFRTPYAGRRLSGDVKKKMKTKVLQTGGPPTRGFAALASEEDEEDEEAETEVTEAESSKLGYADSGSRTG